MKQKQFGIIIMVLSAMAFSIGIILMKVIPEWTIMEPEHVGIWRFTLAAPAYWLIAQFRPSRRPLTAKQRWRFIGAGLVFSMASFSAIFSLARLPSSIFVIVINISPSLVVLFSLFTGRPVPKIFWLGLPLTLIGLTLTAYEFGSALVVDPLGLVIALINATAFGSYIIVSEKVFANVQGRSAGTKWVMTGAMLTGLVLLPILGIRAPGSPIGWVLLVSLGILGTVVPIYTMNVGLQYLGAARGSVITTLQPVLTVLFSTLFLDETLSLQQWLGGALVILAVVLLQRSPDRVRGEQQQRDVGIYES